MKLDEIHELSVPLIQADKARADLLICSPHHPSCHSEQWRCAGHDQTELSATVWPFHITCSCLWKLSGSFSAARSPPEAGGGYFRFKERLHQIFRVVSSWHALFNSKFLTSTWLACSSSHLKSVSKQSLAVLLQRSLPDSE